MLAQVPETRPLEFNILQLEHKMRGNTIPLPKTALKWVEQGPGG